MDQKEFFDIYGGLQLQVGGFVMAPPFTVEELFQHFSDRMNTQATDSASPDNYHGSEKRGRGRPRKLRIEEEAYIVEPTEQAAEAEQPEAEQSEAEQSEAEQPEAPLF